MFFGATAFGQAPFGAVGEAAQQIIITPASHTITLTLSNAYTVQKTHFVNGFLLNSSVNSVTPQLKPVISGQSVSVALNSPTVTADGTIHLATGGGTLTVTLGSEIARVAKILQGTTLTSATSGQQSVSGDALPTISGNSLTSSVGTVALGPGITAPSALVSQVAGIPAADTTFTITVVNVGGYGNVFVVDGVQRPTLTMTKGRKYIFDVSDPTNALHPLRFQTTSGVPITDGVVVTGTQGQAGAKVEITVPFNTFETIRYYCVTHGAAMGNSIDVKGLKVKLAPVVAVTGTSMSSAVNSVTPKLDVFATGTSSSLATSGVNFGYALTVSGNSLTTDTGTLSVFTFSDVDDTTTATIPLTPVDTTGAGGSSWTEVDESGAGTIEGEAA